MIPLLVVELLGRRVAFLSRRKASPLGWLVFVFIFGIFSGRLSLVAVLIGVMVMSRERFLSS
jgi:hypothetical protein